ncbi:hypothetical protein MHU86_231 [Fragilaria crotonensis]|nr:hypothetical protein MHU86_231 [Fragilaria crotonensis]
MEIHDDTTIFLTTKTTSLVNIQGADITMRSNRQSSNSSVASVLSDKTVKASNRDVKGKRKHITEAEEASFFAIWCRINQPQRMTLATHLGMLRRRGIVQQERNDLLSLIDYVLRMGNQSEDPNDPAAAFMTVLRSLTVPGMRAMQTLADTSMLDNTASADLSSIGSNASTEWPAETSHSNSIFTIDTDSTQWPAETSHSDSSFTTDTETYAAMQRQVVQEGPSMEGNVSALTETTASSTIESVSEESGGPGHDSSS